MLRLNCYSAACGLKMSNCNIVRQYPKHIAPSYLPTFHTSTVSRFHPFTGHEGP